MRMLDDPTQHILVVKAGLDISSLGIAFGALAGYLPPAAAVLSLVWTVIQIAEWGLKKIRR